jgi:hypothetical protein
VEALELDRNDRGVDDYLKGTLDLSAPFAEVRDSLSAEQWQEVEQRVAELAAPFLSDGRLHFPTHALVASATA